MSKKFELIIPAKNEYKNLKIILPFLDKSKYRITVIDNSSSDEFKKILLLKKKYNFTLLKQSTKGKGRALREAAEKSKSDVLIFFDADLSHEPNDIKKIINIFNYNKAIDHVGGSRMRGGSDELYEDFDHLIRLFGSIVITLTMNLKFGTKLTDTNNGLRGIKRNKFLKCKTNSIHTTIEMELVAKSLALGYNYVEIPTHEWKRIWGVSKINLSIHSWSFIWQLIKIIFLKKNSKTKINKRNLKDHWYLNTK